MSDDGFQDRAVPPTGVLQRLQRRLQAAGRAVQGRLQSRQPLPVGDEHGEMAECAEMSPVGAPAAAGGQGARADGQAGATRQVRLSENQRRAQEHFGTAFTSTEQAWNKTSMMGISNPLRLENVKEALKSRDAAAVAALLQQVMGPVVGTKASNSFTAVNERHSQALNVILKSACEVVYTGRPPADPTVQGDAGVRGLQDLLLRWVQFGQLAGLGGAASTPLRSQADTAVVRRATDRLAMIALTVSGKSELADALPHRDGAGSALPQTMADILAADQQVTLRMAMVAPVLPALASVGIVARISDSLMSNLAKNAQAWSQWVEPSKGAEGSAPSASAAQPRA